MNDYETARQSDVMAGAKKLSSDAEKTARLLT
jgi:hypothetical protein